MLVSFFKRLALGLAALGARRLAALGLAGLVVFGLVGVSGYYLSRPDREVLYANLDPQDVSRMGAALEESGIAFDVNVAGDTVLVDYGQTAKARMILALKGLPKSDSSGYELFDKMGSLGLTSFMQQVTRVRALEGELARTIQLIDGVKAARVHLALRNEGSFRDASQQPTASVVIRMDGGEPRTAAQAVRHLVAAAIPGLTPEQVTVMSTDGTLLAATDDPSLAAPEKMVGLERTISGDLEQKLSRTLTPYLGIDNFRISVVTKLNTDRRQISETNFDPNSRVERSVRTIKESGEAQNTNSTSPVSVQQNTPQEAAPSAAGDNSREKKDRREELTNYEINSKSIATTTEGYAIDQISVAVVVNRVQLLKSLGDKPTPEMITSQIAELEQLAASAAGLDTKRGDRIKVAAVDFIAADSALEPVAAENFLQTVAGHAGTLINATALLLVSLLILLLGLRPALRVILEARPFDTAPAAAGFAGLPGLPPLPGSSAGEAGGGYAMAQIPGFGSDLRLDDLARQMASSPKDRLAKIVELDSDRAAQVLKQWLNGGGKKTA
ncbi:MAG: flagellar M-ring protein FliF [Rhizobiales bacterium]|nr:flagellar M-ring protein FliF [Hyphomicrobiales bacterium]MBI3672764.1 flagellar M-ring protein FliF [Hyphomicrobiales bacterium]